MNCMRLFLPANKLPFRSLDSAKPLPPVIAIAGIMTHMACRMACLTSKMDSCDKNSSEISVDSQKLPMHSMAMVPAIGWMTFFMGLLWW